MRSTTPFAHYIYAKGWTIHSLTIAAGIGETTLTRLVQGHYRPRLDTLAKIATALGRPMQEVAEAFHAADSAPPTTE